MDLVFERAPNCRKYSRKNYQSTVKMKQEVIQSLCGSTESDSSIVAPAVSLINSLRHHLLPYGPNLSLSLVYSTTSFWTIVPHIFYNCIYTRCQCHRCVCILFYILSLCAAPSLRLRYKLFVGPSVSLYKYNNAECCVSKI